MKEIKKFLQEIEKKKKEPKNSLYYKKLLQNFDFKTINKLKNFIEIINEECNLCAANGGEPPFYIVIDENKFTRSGLTMTDVYKIINLLSSSEYLVIPPKPTKEDLGESFELDSLLELPKDGWDTRLQDWHFKYPIPKNFDTFKKVINEIVGQRNSVNEKGLEVIAKTKKEESKNKFPYKLPAVTKWEHIIIRFLDGHNVEIKASNLEELSHKESYEGMGFLDRRRMMPNKQWELLRNLAENKGTLDWNSRFASLKIKKQKHLLSKTLKDYFDYQIPDDPFLSYKKEGCYKAKFQILSEDYEDIKRFKKYFSKEELENIEKMKQDEKLKKIYKRQVEN